MAKWDKLIALRDDVNSVLELARADKRIGKALEAHVALYATDDEGKAVLETLRDFNLPELFIVSDVKLTEQASDDVLSSGVSAHYPGIRIEASEAEGVKCPRCWMHSTQANADGLCPRCAAVVAEMDLSE